MNATLQHLTHAIALGTGQASASTILVVMIVVPLVMMVVLTGIIIGFFKTWMRAYAAGIPVSYGALIGMRLRKVPASLIIEALIMAHKAGVPDVTQEKLETHCLAGGNLMQVARALVAAKESSIELTFEHAAAIDLDRRDVLAEVREAAQSAPAPQTPSSSQSMNI